MIDLLFSTLFANSSILVPAEPKASPARWIRANDLPPQRYVTRPTTFELSINELGEPSNCKIVSSSGSESLDASICKAVMKRARFRPALGLDGRPTFSIRRDRVSLSAPSRPSSDGDARSRTREAADVVYFSPEVSQIPKERAEVAMMLDASGAVVSCSVVSTSGDARLDELACDIADNPEFTSPPIDVDGQPVAGVRSVSVAFEIGKEERLEIST
jgi:TonB family protein